MEGDFLHRTLPASELFARITFARDDLSQPYIIIPHLFFFPTNVRGRVGRSIQQSGADAFFSSENLVLVLFSFLSPTTAVPTDDDFSSYNSSWLFLIILQTFTSHFPVVYSLLELADFFFL